MRFYVNIKLGKSAISGNITYYILFTVRGQWRNVNKHNKGLYAGQCNQGEQRKTR